MTKNKRPRTTDDDLQRAIKVLRMWAAGPATHAHDGGLERVAQFLEGELEKRGEDRRVYRVVADNPGIANSAGARKFLRRRAERDAL
jgi:hypothetical protein